MTKPERTNYLGNLSYIFKGLLGYAAYISVIPSVTSLINKLRGVNLENWRKTYIAPNVIIDSIYPELITIETGVYITRGTKILSHFNPTDGIAELWGCDSIKKKVVIKKEAFLGVNSIVLPGVTIGAFSITGAGAVVTKDVPDYAIVGGNPAAIIGDVRDKMKGNDN